jgi:hypothetical protein
MLRKMPLICKGFPVSCCICVALGKECATCLPLLIPSDGMPHPTTGSPDFDSTSYTRIGNTINGVRFKQGKAVEVGQAVIVPGKTYTLTIEGINANNQPYHSVAVYDRQ